MKKRKSPENDDQARVCLWRIRRVGEQPMWVESESLCSLCKGKERSNIIYISLVFMN
jgi:hypothetical protein